MFAVPGTGAALCRRSHQGLPASARRSEPGRLAPRLSSLCPCPRRVTAEERYSGIFGNMNLVFPYVTQDWKFTSRKVADGQCSRIQKICVGASSLPPTPPGRTELPRLEEKKTDQQRARQRQGTDSSEELSGLESHSKEAGSQEGAREVACP